MAILVGDLNFLFKTPDTHTVSVSLIVLRPLHSTERLLWVSVRERALQGAVQLSQMESYYRICVNRNRTARLVCVCIPAVRFCLKNVEGALSVAILAHEWPQPFIGHVFSIFCVAYYNWVHNTAILLSYDSKALQREPEMKRHTRRARVKV